MHIKHTDGHFEYIPYFCLPANDLNDVIAPSCYSCFDYPNAVADLVVGYMGVPWQGVNMTEHQQVVTVRFPLLCTLQIDSHTFKGQMEELFNLLGVSLVHCLHHT